MPKASPQRTYLQLTAELTKIMDWFEGDNIDIDQAIVKYQQAKDLLEQIEKYLKTAENQVRKITTKKK